MSEQGPTTPSGYESEHALAVLRRWAEKVESWFLRPPGIPIDHVADLVEGLRTALKCRVGLLGSQHGDGEDAQSMMICTNVEDESEREALRRQLDVLFGAALEAKDGTYGRGLTSQDDSTLICCAKRLVVSLDEEEGLAYALLLSVFDPEEPPDPEFPGVKFLTYDELFLRVAFAFIARYIQHEHSSCRRSLTAARRMSRLSDRRTAAKRVLELEAMVGLPTDPRVLCDWLEAEKQAFVEEETGVEDFKEALKLAGELAVGVQEDGEREDARCVLMECHLARLTKTREKPLLSQRIEEARRLAGLEND